MTYDDLDINQKISYKAAVQAWADYSVAHFKADIDKKVYGLRTSKKGVQSTSLGSRYQFGSGRGLKRTNGLRRTWYQNVKGEGERVVLEFLLYGRFLDMGVGRGTTHTDRLVNRQLKLGATGRSRKPWYSKRKAYEVKRLRELLAQQNINLALDTLESALNITVTLNL